MTAGYFTPEARRAFFPRIDAANVDLKGFSESFYRRLCAGHLEPVRNTLRYLARETDVWFEITNLIIPGENDDPDELRRLSAFIAEELGPHVPVHFSAFHPDFKMTNVPRTPPATLSRAREIARSEGLLHVYSGNVHDRAGDTTVCHECGAELIVRDWYELLEYHLDSHGACQTCGAQCAGVFDEAPGSWGRKRLPLHM